MPVIPSHLSVREAIRAGYLHPPRGGAKVKTRPPAPTPPQRLFTDEFKLRQRVAVIRHEHGWEDGRVAGVIVGITPAAARILGDDGAHYNVYHCRDISPCY